MRIGKLITIEGVEGSGKSTLISGLSEFFKDKKNNFIFTKEPGSPFSKTCESLRRFILDPENEIDKDAEIYLYMADRCQHVNKIIIPALCKGINIICDRYIDSTYAYQGWGRRHAEPNSLEYIIYLNKMSTNGLVPDLTIIMDIDPEIGCERINTKEFGSKDRIEKENLSFFKRVREGFHDLKIKFPERNIKFIDSFANSPEKCVEIGISYIKEII